MSDQSRAPYLEALARHADRGTHRYNVPNHHGGACTDPALVAAFGERALLMDIPPLVWGIDEGEAPHAFEQAQRLAAEAWGAARTWFLSNGASHANHVALLSLAQRGAHEIIVQRNIHSSVLDGLIVSGLTPVFAYPEVDSERGIAHCLTPARLEEAIGRASDPAGVLVVTPTYYGFAADVAGLVEVAHRHGLPIVVDEAWGAHFAFSEELPLDAISAGADLVGSSTHKLLGAFSQAAMTHLGPHSMLDPAQVNRAVLMGESTSPLAALAASLDAARRRAVLHGRELVAASVPAIAALRERILRIPGCDVLDERTVGSFGIAGFDPFRLAVDVRGTGLTGFELKRLLRESSDTFVELFSDAMCVAIVGLGETGARLDRLGDAYEQAVELGRRRGWSSADRKIALLPEPGPVARTPRDAFLAPHRPLGLADAVGEIAAEALSAYPPGIPNVLPGEVLTRPVVEFLADARDRGFLVRGASDPSVHTVLVVEKE